MEVLLAIPVIMIPFLWPVLTGLMAKSFGRKFWLWFFIGIPLPFIAMVILVCLPDRRNSGMQAKLVDPKPVSNEEIFNHLTDEKFIDKKHRNEIYFSASA